MSIYRDGSKRTQPLNTSRDKQDGAAGDVARSPKPPRRHRLPDERQSITHKFDIAGHEGYITVGLYEDGQPGELFLTMAKEGSTISGFADAFAQAISYALQYGVPLQDLVDKFSHVRFEPSGMTKQPGHPLREVDRRLHLPVAGGEVPVAGSAVPRGREQPRRDDDARAAGARRARAARRPAAAAPPAPLGEPAPKPRVEVRRDPEPGRRAAVLDLRLDHGALGRLLQVPELRHDERLRVERAVGTQNFEL